MGIATSEEKPSKTSSQGAALRANDQKTLTAPVVRLAAVVAYKSERVVFRNVFRSFIKSARK